MFITAKKLINPKNLEYNLSSPISSGAFGIVYKGKYHQKKHGEETTTDVAIKVMATGENSQKFYADLQNEISCQVRMKHVALLNLIGFYIPFCSVGSPIIVMPLMENGSLHKVLQLVRDKSGPPEWNETIQAINIIGIAAGLCYMHQNKIIHRDLKTLNILLDQNFHPKVCDFGCSKIFDENVSRILATTYTGTQMYMAPEILEDKAYDEKVDTYAYSMVLYELFTYRYPYNVKIPLLKFVNLVTTGKRPTLNDEFPDFFKKLIPRCWSGQPDERPSFVDILNELLSGFKNGEIFNSESVNKEELTKYIKEVIDGLDGIEVEL